MSGAARSTGEGLVRYETVLLDFDDTLIDSQAAEAAAFCDALGGAGIEDPLRHLASYLEIDRRLWEAVERGETSPDEVRVARFAELLGGLGVAADPKALDGAFGAGLVLHTRMRDGAAGVLDEMARLSRLALVTNGVGDVQRARVEQLGLARYFGAIVISGEVGVAKPAGGFFDLTFRALGSPPRASALIVGDSLASDIAGGAAYGIATCWYNPQRRRVEAAVAPTHEIAHLADLPGLVAGGSPDPCQGVPRA